MPPFSLSTATPQWLAVCAIALAGWGVAAGAAVRWWRSGAGEPRPAGDLALAALLAATTASLGALVPDGPLSFSGVARLPEAWATQPDSILAFMGLRAPLVAMRTLGLSPTSWASSQSPAQRGSRGRTRCSPRSSSASGPPISDSLSSSARLCRQRRC